MSYDFSTLINNCKKWNIVLTEKQIKQFDQYYDLLVEWNSFMNLTAITEFDEVCQKHFLAVSYTHLTLPTNSRV